MPRLSKMRHIVKVALFFAFASVSFAFAAPVTELPNIIFPSQPNDPQNQTVPTLTFFKWGEVEHATVYAFILRPEEGDAPPQFTNGIGGVDPDLHQIWIQPILGPGTNYNFSVQGCEVEDLNLCGPASTLNFKTVASVDPPPDNGGGGGTPAVLENPISSKTLPQLLENILNILFGLSIVILPIIIIYGGILLLTSGGDPTKISQSRTILLWAVIAFAIILLARGLPPVLRGLL